MIRYAKKNYSIRYLLCPKYQSAGADTLTAPDTLEKLMRDMRYTRTRIPDTHTNKMRYAYGKAVFRAVARGPLLHLHVAVAAVGHRADIADLTHCRAVRRAQPTARPHRGGRGAVAALAGAYTTRCLPIAAGARLWVTVDGARCLDGHGDVVAAAGEFNLGRPGRRHGAATDPLRRGNLGYSLAAVAARCNVELGARLVADLAVRCHPENIPLDPEIAAAVGRVTIGRPHGCINRCAAGQAAARGTYGERPLFRVASIGERGGAAQCRWCPVGDFDAHLRRNGCKWSGVSCDWRAANGVRNGPTLILEDAAARAACEALELCEPDCLALW